MKNLTAYNECNEREINSMVGKAMCAYANMLTVIEKADKFDSVMEAVSAKRVHESEYEATIRCIDMFVRESLYEIQALVKQRVADEFGIE